MQYSGMITGIILLLLDFLVPFTFTKWSDFQFGLFLYILIFPTFITAFIIKNRVLKDVARFMLGLAFMLAFFLLLITPNWFVKGFILLNFLPGYYYLQKRREIKNEEVCIECHEYKHRPYCNGYQIYQDREAIFLGHALQGGLKDPFALSPESLDD
jgi:hypothetical protein